jgi:magnesium-protoporphyrin IX monomethyl ester (oxidative) cyclase
MQAQRLTAGQTSRTPFRAAHVRRGAVTVRASAATDEMGFKLMRDGIKQASKETILTPRFYTTGRQHRLSRSRRHKANLVLHKQLEEL